jgi:hypothetical protein
MSDSETKEYYQLAKQQRDDYLQSMRSKQRKRQSKAEAKTVKRE